MSGLKELLRVLQCPVSHGSLREFSLSEVEELNQGVTSGTLQHLDGSRVKSPLTAGLISSDGSTAYRMEKGILILLRELGIDVRGARRGRPLRLRSEKKIVKNFYDEFGWRRQAGGSFNDSVLYTDRRPATLKYATKCNQRVVRHLRRGGTYLLDVASGPIPSGDYLEYSRDFEFRICVDLSLLALLEAQAKLGDKGLYILGDITNLPFNDDTMDAVISLHTIYHVPEDEQEKAFREIHRVLKPGATAVAVYTWKRSYLMSHPFKSRLDFTIKALAGAANRLRQKILRSDAPGGLDHQGLKEPYLYFRPHDYEWFHTRLERLLNADVRVWSSINMSFTLTYIHRWLLGGALLWVIYQLEEMFPLQAGRLGQYPLFVIRKMAGSARNGDEP